MFNKTIFLKKMEEILEMEEETLNLNDELEILNNWDSLTMLSFIAMIDEHYEVSLPNDEVTSCVTVDDLADLVKRAVGN